MLNDSSMKLTCDISVLLNSAQSKTIIHKNIFSLTSAKEVWAGKNNILQRKRVCFKNYNERLIRRNCSASSFDVEKEIADCN